MADDPKAGAPIVVRFDLLIEAQKKMIEHVGHFVADATAMTLRGEISPTLWLKRYGDMLSELAKDLGTVGKD